MKTLIVALLTCCLFLFSCSPSKSIYTTSTPYLDNAIIIDLNQLTYTLANEHDQFYSFIGVRTLSMVHLAAHDILNSVYPKFETYAFQRKFSNVNLEIAIAEATRVLLSNAYPTRVDTIKSACEKWMNGVMDSTVKIKSIRLGTEVAQAYIQLRENDGHKKQGNYTPMTKPGDYQYTPEYDWVWKPDFSVAQPFTLDTVTQFRSPPPPALDSEAYLDSYNEVKAYGVKNSVKRTEDQTNFAHWWAEFAEHSWNRIGRITAAKKKLPLHETARLFALINMNLYDLYLASMESKYYYDTWRPYTAIRAGDDDSNPKTVGDSNWEPEMLTPPWPEYPSAHAAVGASGAEIVSHVFGTPKVSFTMESVTALPTAKIRTYTNLNKAADDCADSRIMNGYHFRFATEEGKKQGRVVAKHTIAHFLGPIEKIPASKRPFTSGGVY